MTRDEIDALERRAASSDPLIVIPREALTALLRAARVVEAMERIGSVRLLRDHDGFWSWMLYCTGESGSEHATAADAVLAAAAWLEKQEN